MPRSVRVASTARADHAAMRLVGQELVRSALVAKLAVDLDDPVLLRRSAERSVMLAQRLVDGDAGPVPDEVRPLEVDAAFAKAYPRRSVFADVAEGEAA